MKRTFLLASLAVLMVASLALAPPVDAYHPKKQGNAIVCPKGTIQNPAGTTCTDKKTGEWVKPIKRHTVYPTRHPADKCPEFWKPKKSGDGCKKDRELIRWVKKLNHK